MIELVVVILIIIVLAGLLLPAITGAFRTATRARQVDDMYKLKAALEAFKGKYGIYPPSRIRLREGTAYNMTEGFDAFSVKMLKRIWPSINPVTTTTPTGDPNTAAVADPNRRFLWCVDAAGKELDRTQWTRTYELEGDECLVFFLGGISQFVRDPTTGEATGEIILHGFTKRANDPSGIPNSAEPATLVREESLHTFDAKRLYVRSEAKGEVALPPAGAIDTTSASTAGVLVAGHGFPGSNGTRYLSSGGGAAAWRLPSFFSLGVDDPLNRRPWAYFSGYDGAGYRPDDCNLPGAATAEWFESLDKTAFASTAASQQFQCKFLTVRTSGAYPICESMAPNPYCESVPLPTGGSVIRWHQPNAFQLVSTGPDGKYGPGGQLPRSKSGADSPPTASFIDLQTTGSSYDNITSVSDSSDLGTFNEQQKR
jgi:general secretion pathway protein G